MNLNEKVIEKLVCYKFGWTHNFDSLHNWVITDSICSAMRWVISGCSPHVRFFGLHLERSLNTSVDKESNAFCIFASLRVYGSNFLQLGSIFCWNAQKKGKKADRIPILRKICYPFSQFPFINIPTQMKIFLYSTYPLFLMNHIFSWKSKLKHTNVDITYFFQYAKRFFTDKSVLWNQWNI